jgi:2-keto-4-pentenoate hydratase
LPRPTKLRAAPAPDATLDELFDALDWLAPGFEIVQSHRPDWRFTAVDTVADSGLHAHLRVGQRVPVRNCAANAAELDPWLATARVKLFKSNPDAGPEVGRQAERLIDEGSGANVLDSPLRALQYFVRELAQCPGATALQPGDVVTTGTWTDAWPVQPGECWTAQFSAMGAVAVPGLQMAFS